jgi:hypothetical protein
VTEQPKPVGINERVINERLALNEAIERDLNALQAHWSEGRQNPQGFWCECSRPDCNQMIEVFKREWDAVRASPYLFFVAPRHDEPRIANVVDMIDRFWVVEKVDPTAKRIAEQTDPATHPILGDVLDELDDVG